MDKERRIELQRYLRRLIRHLNRSGKSTYAEMTPDEIVGIIRQSRSRPDVIRSLLLPTGDLQEIAIDNGWGRAFNKLASEIERVLEGEESAASASVPERAREEKRLPDEDPVASQIRMMMQGLAEMDYKKVFQAYKALYSRGKEVLPALQKRLLAHDWSKRPYKREMRYLCGLFNLVHDIDETASRETAQAIVDSGCTAQVLTCLRLVLHFSLRNYVALRYGKIEIYISRKLKNPREIYAHLQQWLAVLPRSDLDGLVRIYVSKPNEEQFYLGTYTPYLAAIELVWDVPAAKWRIFARQLRRYRAEHTFYHEIGHHVHRHTFGQVPWKEREADAYAEHYFCQRHFQLCLIGDILELLHLKRRQG